MKPCTGSQLGSAESSCPHVFSFRVDLLSPGDRAGGPGEALPRRPCGTQHRGRGVVLVGLHTTRFSFSRKAVAAGKFKVLVSQLK